eukprot:g13676.t1
MTLLEIGVGVDCWGGLCNLAKKFTKAVKNKYHEVKEKVTDTVEDVVDDVKDKYHEVKGKVKEKYHEVKGKVKETIEDVKDKVEDVVDDVKDKYHEVKENVLDAADSFGDELTGQRTGKDKDLKGPPVSPSDVDVDLVSFTAFASVHAYTREDGTIPADYPMQQIGETINVPYNSVSAKFIRSLTSEKPGAVAKVYKTKDGTCIVAYRGTAIKSDWLVNLKVGKIGMKDIAIGAAISLVSRTLGVAAVTDRFLRGTKNSKNQCVHAGFYEHMKLSLPKVVKILAENDCKPETTVLTGHSLGGATATLASLEGIGKKLYTYGAPRSLCKSCPSELEGVESHRFVSAYVAKHTDNKRDYTEIYDIVTQGFFGLGIARKCINGAIGLHDTGNYIKVLAKVSPEPLLHDLTYRALAKANPKIDYDKPAITEEAFEEASKEMYNDANGVDDEENDPSGGDDAGGIVDSNTMAKSNGDSNDVKNGAKTSAGSGGDDAGGIVDSNTMAKSNGDSNDVKNGAKTSAGSGGDDAGGIVDSNTMAKSNGDSNDVKNGAKKSAGVDSAPLSDLKDRIIKEVKRSNSPSTLKSVENILHELNTH